MHIAIKTFYTLLTSTSQTSSSSINYKIISVHNKFKVLLYTFLDYIQIFSHSLTTCTLTIGTWHKLLLLLVNILLLQNIAACTLLHSSVS